MSSPLPRVYEEVGGGRVLPTSASAASAFSGATQGPVVPIGGADYNGDEMSHVIKSAGKLVESEVLAPMERWMNAFVLIQQRMKRLEALRLEVDSRRRTVARLGKKASERGPEGGVSACVPLGPWQQNTRPAGKQASKGEGVP